ncbi:MAG: hypothetical protein ACP5JH_00275 [Bacteroidota bacterium]
MKRAFCIVALVLAFFGSSVTVNAQLKTQLPEAGVTQSLLRNPTGIPWFGLFDPSRFQMRHSLSFSYLNIGGQSLSMGMYTNSMFYQISNPLSVRLDVSMIYSPMGSFSPRVQNSLNGIFINRAEINYRPSKDFLLQFQFRQTPFVPPLAGWYGLPYYSGLRTGLESAGDLP